MTKKYVLVKFTKTATTEVVAQVESDLSGDELEGQVAVPQEWMREYFGDEWEEWEIENVMEITEQWSILRNRHTNTSFNRELNEAPLFEIASVEEDA